MFKLNEPMKYQWRVQQFSKHKPQAMCVAYIDARDVMDRLDEVCGSENWQSDFKEVAGKIYAGIGIKDKQSNEWVWKWDVGDETDIEAAKGQASDAFKRAAVKWGIGRFLYDIKVKTVKTNEAKKEGSYPYVIDDNGQRVWDLTKHINGSNRIANYPEHKPGVNDASGLDAPKAPKQAPQRTKSLTAPKDTAALFGAAIDKIKYELKRLGYDGVESEDEKVRREEVAKGVSFELDIDISAVSDLASLEHIGSALADKPVK